MLKNSLLFCFIITMLSSYSQSQEFEWVRQMGGKGDDFGCAIAVDDAGNTYSTGTFKNTVDFDPGPGTYYLTVHDFIAHPDNTDIYVTKLDAEGNFLWAVQIGDTLDEGYPDLIINKKGEIYVKSYFKGTLDTDPGPGIFNLTSASGSSFIVKMNTDGTFLWAEKIRGSAFVLDKNDNIYITGSFSGKVDFDMGSAYYELTANGGYDVCVTKLNAAGYFLWAIKIGGYYNDFGSTIALDAAGNILVTGQFQDSMDFDPGIGKFKLKSKYNDVFILKLDPAGQFIWARNMGPRGYRNTIWLPMITDKNKNIYTAGWFEDSIDVDPGASIYNLKSKGSWDIYISKLDSSGHFVWGKRTGGISDDYASSLALDAAGNLLISGTFMFTSDFDPDTGTFNMTAYNFDGYILQLNPEGQFMWAKDLHGFGVYEPLMAVDKKDNIYISSFFQKTVDFDPGPGVFNLTSNGTYDLFVLKLQSPTSGVQKQIVKNELIIYPNPSSGVLQIRIENKERARSFEIFNTMGELVYSTHQVEDVMTVDLSTHAAGIYLIKVTYQNRPSVVQKIIKQ